MAGESLGYEQLPDENGYHIAERVVEDALERGQEPPLWCAGGIVKDTSHDLLVRPVLPENRLVSDPLDKPLDVRRTKSYPDDYYIDD
jgi:hypothetical protein